MAVLEIQKYPEPVLKEKARLVEDITEIFNVLSMTWPIPCTKRPASDWRQIK